MIFKVIGLALLALAADHPAPPWIRANALERPSNLRRSPASDIRFGAKVFELEEATLDEVAAALGGKPWISLIRAHEQTWREWTLCYRTAQAAGSPVVWLTSDTEMGGARRSLMTVILDGQPSRQAETGCPVLPAAYRTVRVRDDLQLPLTRQALQDHMETKGYPITGGLAFHFNKPIPGGGTYSSVRAEIRKGQVVRLQIDQTTSF